MIAQVERFPLDDDEVFVSDLKMLSGGAAANTASACSKLGLKTAFIGKLGKDDVFGTKIYSDFKEVSVDTKFLKYSDKYKTGSAYVALNRRNKNRRIFAHSGAANFLSKNDIKKEELISTTLIYLSSLKNIEPFIEAAKIGGEYETPVVLNPGMLIIEQGLSAIKPLLKWIDILIISKREFTTLLNISNIKFSKRLFVEKSRTFKDFGIKTFIITLGKEGALLISGDKSQYIAADKVNNVEDTTGAGDAFSAGFIYGYLQMKEMSFQNLIIAVKLGNFVAGKCIKKLGAREGIPSEEKILARLLGLQKEEN
jgi:ribokinase